MAVERSLTQAELSLLRPYFQQQTLAVARVVEGKVPFWLRRGMCAVVLAHRIYLRADLDRPRAYQAGTASGVELLAHELTHVEQFLSGMTIFRYLWASRRGYRNNPFEIEAYAKAAMIKSQIFPDYLFKSG